MDSAVSIESLHLSLAVIAAGVLLGVLAVTAIWARGASRERRAVARVNRGLALLVERAVDPIIILSATGELRYVNTAAGEAFGYQGDDVPTSVLAILHPDEVGAALADLAEAQAGNPLVGVNVRRVRAADGRWVPCEHVITNLLREPGVAGIVVTLRDVTERLAAEAAAASEHAYGQAILDTTTALVVTLGLDGRIESLNRAAERLTGYATAELVGQPAGRLIPPEERTLPTEGMAVEQFPTVVENHVVHRDGARHLVAWNNAVVVDEHGTPTRIVATGIDVTAERRAQRVAEVAERREHDRLAYEATHDALTDVLNRAGLLHELDRQLRQLGPGGPMAVLFLDLDGFKAINDTFGHQVGDRVLRAVADRIVDAVRTTDVVGRLGGDEFVVLCPGLTEELAISTAERIGAAIAAPLDIDGIEVRCGASTGVVTAIDGDADALLTAADASMYEVKRARRELRPATGASAAAPVDPRESLRLSVLRRLGLFESEGQADPFVDTIVRLAADVCGAPMAAVSLIDVDRQFFTASVGIDATETPRSVAFCAHSILDPEQVTVVADARRDVRFRDNPLVTGDPNIRSYAGAPLTVDGTAIGALCVIDRSPRALTDDQLDTLARLRDSLVTYLELTAPEGAAAVGATADGEGLRPMGSGPAGGPRLAAPP
ncbi:MAG: diguanylate cyclase [Acidimicrobiales bacterium]|nr:diguanylate cyclase [Acidimicrobiales bacterium]